MTKPRLAVVIPIYNEQEVFPELTRRLLEVIARMTDFEWQVIYVNDGSSDESLRLMLEQHQRDERFAVLDLSRNFGHQAAITAGLMAVDADAVITMDGDLQDPPEVIPELVQRWRQGAQVVRAERKSRGERGWRRFGFWLFHYLIGWVSDDRIPAHAGVFGLLDREALTALRKLPESNRFFPGLRAWIGFEQQAIQYDRPNRPVGAPKQSFAALFRYAMDAVFGFSYKPLRLLMWTGTIISLSGFGVAAYFIVKRLLGMEPAVTGFTTLVTLLLFLGGIQLIALGLLGEYLGRIYDEVKQRPLFVVRGRYGIDAPKAGAALTPPKDAADNST